MQTIEEIKKAVRLGKSVYWKNDAYIVIYDSLNQYMIKYIHNDSCVGLTNDYDPADFYTKD